MTASPYAWLLRTLEARDHISATERALIERIPYRLQSYRRNQDVVAEGSRPSESCLLLEGLVVRTNMLRDGGRQISAVHLPGDFVDIHGFLLKVMDHGITALTPCNVAYVPHTELRHLTETEPHLGRMLWLLTAIDAAIERAWIKCLGRQSAVAHLAHLICEIYARLEVVGLAENGTFGFGISQVDLSDMLGISAVHANRVLQDMRGGGLLAWNGGQVQILDHPALARLGEFNPTYLNLVREPR